MMASPRNLRRQRQAAARRAALDGVWRLGCRCDVELVAHGGRFADNACLELERVAIRIGLTESETIATIKIGYAAGLAGRASKRSA